jgi:hypothetical protein
MEQIRFVVLPSRESLDPFEVRQRIVGVGKRQSVTDGA